MICISASNTNEAISQICQKELVKAGYFKQTLYNIFVKIKCRKPSNDIKDFTLVIYSVKSLKKNMVSCCRMYTRGQCKNYSFDGIFDISFPLSSPTTFLKTFIGYRKHTLIQNMPEWDCVKSTWNVPFR